MNKKELRKELEHLLVRSIETVLSKKNAAAAKSLHKNTISASKTLAKKFYRSLKTKTVVKNPAKKLSKTIIKKPVRTTKRPSAKSKK